MKIFMGELLHEGFTSDDVFPHPLDEMTKHKLPATTVREFLIMRMVNVITDKPDWHTKVFNAEIVAKWSKEIREANDVTENMMGWIIEQVKYKALFYQKTGLIGVYNSYVAKSDTIVPEALKLALREAVASLENVPDDQKDYHPGSNNQVLDLVHPSLFPLIYGRSRAVPEEATGITDGLKRCGEGEIFPKFADRINDSPERYPDWGVSRNYQWLPCEVRFKPICSDTLAGGENDSRCEISSYINNLHPRRHQKLYKVIEQVIDCAIPLWNTTLSFITADPSTRINYDCVEYSGDVEECFDGEPPEGMDEDDWYDNQEEAHLELQRKYLIVPDIDKSPGYCEPKAPYQDAEGWSMMGVQKYVDLKKDFGGLQVIVKLANIHLTPEKAEYPGGSWHVEGQLNERICATALYYYDNENISDSRLAFRQRCEDMDYELVNYPQNHSLWANIIFGLERDGPLAQDIGSVQTGEGRLLTFPNILRHQVQPFKLQDPTKPGYRKILALFLVDPHFKIPSTATIPVQRRDWWEEMVPMDRILHPLPQELKDMVAEDTELAQFPISMKQAKEIRLNLMEERKERGLNDDLIGARRRDIPEPSDTEMVDADSAVSTPQKSDAREEAEDEEEEDDNEDQAEGETTVTSKANTVQDTEDQAETEHTGPMTPAQGSDAGDSASRQNSPPRTGGGRGSAIGVPRRRRLGRPPKNKPPDWDAPDDAAGEARSGVTTPVKRGRGRGRPYGGGRWAKSRGGPSHVTQVPIDKEGNMMDVVNDEVDLPEDPEGETKVDKMGNLLGNREYRVRTFTILNKGKQQYMLSTEPARCIGFRDSYLFFQKHKLLYKIIIDDEQKRDMIDRAIIPHSYKGRAIGVVTARSVFREFGAKIIIGGRKVIDDYHAQAARERGDVEGEVAVPEDRLPPPGEKYNKNQYVAWHGASSVYHSGAPSVPAPMGKIIDPKKRKVLVTGDNWMLEHARAASQYNSALLEARRKTLNGVYDIHTNTMLYPNIMQPTHVRWEAVPPSEKDEQATQKLLHSASDTIGVDITITLTGSAFRAPKPIPEESHQVNMEDAKAEPEKEPNGQADAIMSPAEYAKAIEKANAAACATTETTIFPSLPSIYSRNFRIHDVHYESPAYSGMGIPGPDGDTRDVGSNGLTIWNAYNTHLDPSMAFCMSAEILAELPPDCREAYMEAAAREGEWKNRWAGEVVDGSRAKLPLNFAWTP
ncbi:hypothetical protein FQN57_000031 [Myotisia sp. PD_48]|nr:hypothetical protein FQN57_000031 [Myotisia sp. PD_48]